MNNSYTYHENRYSLYLGDVVEELSRFDDNSFDACFCDPPYLLEFMGKGFDRQHKKMEGENDGQKMYQWHLRWCREVYRVLKPGGFILAFGGTRTIHRLACAVEDVGFEVRDMVSWLYGQGFPKSLDISKAIGRDQSALWFGYGTALKPAHEPLVLAMKPCTGTFAENAIEWGVAGLNVDGGRIGTTKDVPASPSRTNGYTLNASIDGSFRNETGLESGHNPNTGRWPANLILSHHLSCQEVGTKRVRSGNSNQGVMHGTGQGSTYLSTKESGRHFADSEGLETVSKWDCYELCPVKLLDEQSGGNVSRFFYQAKVSASERNLGGIDCRHPTLKPIDLCRYFATLLLPPTRSASSPRQLLIPFSGAGSEVSGSLLAGWGKVIGIEFDPEYIEWSKHRVSASIGTIEDNMKTKPGTVLHSSLSPFVNSSSNFPRADRRIGVIAREATHHPPGSKSIEVEWEGPSFVSTCAGEYVDPDDADGLVRKKLLELARDCRTVAKELIEHAYRLEQTAGQETVIAESGEVGEETRMEVLYESQETKRVGFMRPSPAPHSATRVKEIDADEL